jgi:glucokinase
VKLALVGDIGGTNARFAIWEDNALHSVRVFPTIDYASPEKALEVYLEGLNLYPGDVGSICLAVAGPVGGDVFHFTNSHWRISRSEFCAHLKVDNLLMVNDFTAMALGMTRLKDDEYLTVCHGISDTACPRVVIGPGTGLGVGTLIGLADNHWMALPGEGGHVDLPLGTPREAQIWARLMTELEHVSAETILSGAGLLLLYQTSCSLDNIEPTLKSPAAITSAAVAGDPVAAAVLEQFCCLHQWRRNTALQRFFHGQRFCQIVCRKRLDEGLLQGCTGVAGDRRISRSDGRWGSVTASIWSRLSRFISIIRNRLHS